MTKTKEILTLSVEIADVLLRNGAEIYRIEDTVIHILEAYDVEDFDVYVLSNGIFASANEGKEDACSMIRHVPLGSIHLARISALNQLIRDICNHRCSLIEAWERLEKCRNLPTYPIWLLSLCCGMGSAGLCYIFGGHLLDCLFAFTIGSLEELLILYFSKKKLSKFLSNVFVSIFVTTLSVLALFTSLPIAQDKIVIGALMPIVPGIAFTTSIRDFYNGDYLSGTIHLIDALLTGLCIAVGVCISIAVFRYLGGGALLP